MKSNDQQEGQDLDLFYLKIPWVEAGIASLKVLAKTQGERTGSFVQGSECGRRQGFQTYLGGELAAFGDRWDVPVKVTCYFEFQASCMVTEVGEGQVVTEAICLAR